MLMLVVLQLAAREPGARDLLIDRGMDAVNVLLDLEATPHERSVLLAIGWHESRWLTTAVNAKGGDCGPTQIRNPEAWGSTCARITSDPAEGYRVALRILRHARSVCPGTWGRSLTVYVSGQCGVAPRKAREICSPVGLCEERY